MYLTDAVPWTRQGDERAVEVLRYIVADQKGSCARLAHYLQSHHVPLNTGHYPMSFTDTNDLSLSFLLSLLAECQRTDIATIERLIPRLELPTRMGWPWPKRRWAAPGTSGSLARTAQPDRRSGRGAGRG